MAQADAINFRAPYQTNKDLRERINAGTVKYIDMNLSVLAQEMRYGFYGKFNWAIVEACDVSDDGEIVLTTSVGIAPTALHLAEKIIIELNEYHPAALRGIHDIIEMDNPPFRKSIPIFKVSDRGGSQTVKVDPKKIVGIVKTNSHDEVAAFKPSDPITHKIGENVANFFAAEMRAGRIPNTFLPLQSGVGNIANAVLKAMGEHPEIPAFTMYSEVAQDSVIDLVDEGRINFVSATSLTITPDKLQKVYSNLDYYKSKIVLRPQEISNNPEVSRRIGIISINTAIEADLFGNVNSTHIMGQKMMNGIGGSADFTSSGYLSIFTTPSLAKGGLISSFVPMCSHVDHTEHTVKILVSEYGVADLRGKTPMSATDNRKRCSSRIQRLAEKILILGKTRAYPANPCKSLRVPRSFCKLRRYAQSRILIYRAYKNKSSESEKLSELFYANTQELLSKKTKKCAKILRTLAIKYAHMQWA